jgi:hypothetical protein
VAYPIDLKENLQNSNFGSDNMYSTTQKTNFVNFQNPVYDPDFNYKRTQVQQVMNTAVLKFHGFFTEEVNDSRLETNRVRHLEISFFIEDNSISIIEPRQRNSGILQGPFLKRQKVLGSDQKTFLNPFDFRIGEFITICARRIFLIGCDPFTRNFYEKIGAQQSEDLNVDEDNYERIILKSFEPKAYYGLNSTVLNGRVPLQKQFLENDRKVLKFWVESQNEPFVVHYYLADDTIEVCEVKVVNSGKNPFPHLMRRQKMPSRYNVAMPGFSRSDNYLTYEDFKPNSSIEFLGRSFKILGCDAFTKNFFEQTNGQAFNLYSGEHSESHSRPELIIPPHNGFGNEEDSLQNVLRLVPKPPKKDFYNLMNNTGMLKLNGILLTDKKSNSNR